MSVILQVAGQLLPATLLQYVPLVVLLTCVCCKLITVAIPPPAPTSRWLGLYHLISQVGLNIGWAVNAYQSGKCPILVPVEDSHEIRILVSEKLDMPREELRP